MKQCTAILPKQRRRQPGSRVRASLYKHGCADLKVDRILCFLGKVRNVWSCFWWAFIHFNDGFFRDFLGKPPCHSFSRSLHIHCNHLASPHSSHNRKPAGQEFSCPAGLLLCQLVFRLLFPEEAAYPPLPRSTPGALCVLGGISRAEVVTPPALTF